MTYFWHEAIIKRVEKRNNPICVSAGDLVVILVLWGLVPESAQQLFFVHRPSLLAERLSRHLFSVGEDPQGRIILRSHTGRLGVPVGSDK